MPTMKDNRSLRVAPDGDQTGDIVMFGEEVEILDQQGKWSKVKVLDAGLQPTGWLPTETIDPTGASGSIPPGPIDKNLFAGECWLEAIYFGGNAHFLMIIAELRSGIQSGADGDRIGPFRFTAEQWNKVASDDEFDIKFAPQNIKNWRIECVVAALVTQRARKALEAANKEIIAIGLYSEWLNQIGEAAPADQAQLEKDMQAAIDATKEPCIAAGKSLVETTAPTINSPDAPATSGSTTPPQINGGVRALLDFVALAEAPLGYDQMFGERTSTKHNLQAMSIDEVMAFQKSFTDGGKASSAAGRYQIIRKTLAGLKASINLPGTTLFDSACQDRLATQLLVNRGLNKRLANNMNKQDFANRVAMEWASMPVVSAIKGACGFNLTPGQSYYDGVGQNHALVKVAAFLAVVP